MKTQPRITHPRKAAVLLFVLGLVLTACGDDSSADVEGSWQLVSGSFDGDAIEPEAANPVTLEFDGEMASGHAGCNSFSGGYTQEGTSIEFGEIAITQMACPALDLETLYTAALSDVNTASVDGDELTLSGPDSELVFESTA
jgi:heat shock protein HslJ